jgi:hypothetical protein
MLSLLRGDVRLPLCILCLGSAFSVLSTSPAVAGAGGHGADCGGHHGDGETSYGTLGWAPDGLYPGFYGFSLRWHPGYGYGLYALGVGADGGYPAYAGPGYPHEPPPLNRCGPEAPYLFNGGPDYPRIGYSNYFQEIGGFVIDKPVVSVGEPGDFGYVDAQGDVAPGRDFGSFTGALPYPETKFAPYAAEAAMTGSSYPQGPGRSSSSTSEMPEARRGAPSASLSPGVGEVTKVRGPGRYLGIDEEPTVDSGGTAGIKVTRVFPGSPAEATGLRVGDVIHSINGYLTTERGNLAWIISVATPNNVLKMYVRTASDGKVHEVLADLPIPPVNTDRPSFLPPVGNGPPPASR